MNPAYDFSGNAGNRGGPFRRGRRDGRELRPAQPHAVADRWEDAAGQPQFPPSAGRGDQLVAHVLPFRVKAVGAALVVPLTPMKPTVTDPAAAMPDV